METTRLRFERLCKDTDSIRTLYTHLAQGENIEEATEYVLWSPHTSLHETQSLLKEAGEQWRNGDAANYIVRPQPGEDRAGEFAGKTELAIDWSRRAGELAVYLRKPFWGREYADDCFHALSELAFQHLDLEVVEAECAVENERSRRSIEKFIEAHGGDYAGVLRNWRIPDGGEPLDSHHFSITQEQYFAEK
ncbi:GNAT family N-acetyltransferase [Haladaptatus halobius]|uniref:GNAT family N-acetyltransferase n=1 Tax=Haladaptatus halobius TaxID=2884875 RepID=UPI001D0A1C35|nr:GNAT family N-acetyltransferase [Haladaptatus halobius]